MQHNTLTKKYKTMVYIARDKDYSINLYTEIPTKSESWWVGNSKGKTISLPEDSFMDVLWTDDEPRVLSDDEIKLIEHTMLHNIELHAHNIVKNFKHLGYLGIDVTTYVKQFDETFNSTTEFLFPETI